MKVLAGICLFVAAGLAAQQPPAASPASSFPEVGQVTGRVFCGDTDAPARFATVQLISETPDHGGFANGEFPLNNPQFQKALVVLMSSMVKGSSLSALSGIDGSFSMDAVPPGTYYAVGQLAGYQSPLSQFSQSERMKADKETLKAIKSVTEKVVVQANQVAHIELRLERGASLSGTIRYDDGSPAPEVTPVLMQQGKDGKWKQLDISLIPLPTDDRGRYRIFGLSPGKYAVKATLPTVQTNVGLGASSLSGHMQLGDALVIFSGGALRDKDLKPIEVGIGEDIDGVDLVFPLSGLHAIAGSVVAKADNHLVSAGMLTLLDAETKTPLRTDIIARDGNFRLNYVPEGQYIVRVTGAADTEPSQGGEMENDMFRMMGNRPTKRYGDAELPLVLKADALSLVLSVPDLDSKNAPPGQPPTTELGPNP